jgi:hypothetical protein
MYEQFPPTILPFVKNVRLFKLKKSFEIKIMAQSKQSCIIKGWRGASEQAFSAHLFIFINVNVWINMCI